MNRSALSIALLTGLFAFGSWGYSSGVLPPCDAQSAHAQEAPPVPAPIPTPSPELTVKLHVAERFKLGEPIEITADTNAPEGARVAWHWEPSLPSRARPGSKHGLYLWASTSGTYPVRVNVSDGVGFAIDTVDVVVGDPVPPPPPKTLAELAGDKRQPLVDMYTARIATLQKKELTGDEFWFMHSQGLIDAKLAGHGAEAAIKTRLEKVAPHGASLIDAHAVIVELQAIIKELDAEPTPPPQPPVVVGKRAVIVLRETEDNTPAIGILTTALRTGEAAAYLTSKGHTLDILDDDNPAPIVQKLVALNAPEPALFILDAASGAVLSQQPLPATAAEVLNILKANGG